MKKFILFLSVFFLLAAFAQVSAAPGNPSIGPAGATNLSGYAWSSNIGWISFSGPNYQVTYDPGANTFGPNSYAWSSNIGWINFSNISLPGGIAHVINASCGGNCSSGWDGQIHLSGTAADGTNYGVSVGGAGSDELRGFAWGSDVVGWVKFCDPSNGLYCVRLGGLTANCQAAPVGTPPTSGTWTASVSGGTGSYSYDWSLYDSTPTLIDSVHHSGNGNSTDSYSPAGPLAPSSYQAVASIRDLSSGKTTSCSATLDLNAQPVPTYPTLTIVNNQGSIEISSQPLTSPAISSGIAVQVSDPSTDPLNVQVLDIVSLVTGKSLIKPIASGGILTGSNNQQFPTCHFSDQSLSQNPSAPFDDCLTAPAVPMIVGGTRKAYFNIRIHRPVQVIKDHNPYRVTLGDPNVPASVPNSRASFIFDYRAGTVNPV